MFGRQKTGARRGLPCLRPGTPPPARAHLVAVPGAEAPAVAVDLPKGVTGPARLRVARQQVADRLGVAPGSISVLPLGTGAFTRVVVIDRARLRTWVGARGRSCRAVVPDYLTLPDAPGTVHVARDGDDILVRLGPDNGFAAPIGVAPVLLARALSGAGARRAVAGEDVPAAVVAPFAAAGLDVAHAPIDLSRAPAPGIDLGQGLADEARGGARGAWIAAAVVALAAFGLWAASVIVETRALDRETAAVRAGTEAVLRGGLIPSGPLLDVRAQVARTLTEAQGDAVRADLARLDLLSRVSVVVFGRGLEVGEIALDARGLSLAVTAPDFDTAEQLAADLDAEGLPARTETLRARDGGGVEARFAIALPEGAE